MLGVDVRVALVGAGGVGRALARLMIREGIEVRAYDVSPSSVSKALMDGISVTNDLVGLVRWCDHVLISVPSSEVVKVLKLIRGLTTSSTEPKVVYDVSTFKEGLIREYLRFPKYVKVSSIHPMFGPGIKSPSKHVVLLTPIPTREVDSYEVEYLLNYLGFRVVKVGIEEHDELVAKYVGTSYIVATALAEFMMRYGLSLSSDYLGTTFKLLTNHCLAVMHDSPEFISYVLSNEYVRKYLRGLLEVLKELLSSSGKAELIARSFREYVGTEAIDLAYRRLYEFIEGTNH